MPNFKNLLEYYMENNPTHKESKIKFKNMQFFMSSPDQSIYTYND